MPLRRNRWQYEQLTDFDRGRIIGLREAGWSNRRIGRHLGRSDMVVARCWQQWITEGRVYRRGGHPVPSRETIRRRLTEVGLRSRRPLRRLPLTPHHRQCRLDFCRPRATWSVTDWRRVIFSDESRFSLSADDHRTRVWRRTGSDSIRHLLSSGIQQFHKVPIINRIMLVHILHDSPNNVFKDMTSYHGLPGRRSFANRACLERAGKATAAVPRYRRINCADAKIMAGSSTGGHK
ncbi:HTH_Tnp_Tc3_2 domain-containing protein [Trichonephila clavipes]|uniref:HTH_Tnp_Tc3_2 domain-containing protein n=1 Tax=Trichonephila clavipes TaxID=2585209 RepID=A0A8X6SFF4_TRICX|nr:HTH_Tnp_Tc3_2 domain-containing protein [Trichonephila clavipes]